VTAHVVIELHPAIEQRICGGPDESAVVAVTDGEHASGPQDSAHFDKRRDGTGQVLEHLVGVDDVE